MNDFAPLPSRDLTHSAAAPRDFADLVRGAGNDRALIAFEDPEAHARNMELSLSLLSALGPVLAVYPQDGCWSALSVRTDADPGRTHGVGENRLHVDLVDRTLMPRYIALYCVRADPRDGGASALANLREAIEDLTDTDRAVLEEPVFSYFTDQGVHGVGSSLDTFAVLPPPGERGPVRFTAKILPHLEKGELLTAGTDTRRVADAFGRFAALVERRRTTVRLLPGQLLVFDQHRYAHGRMPLGPDQAVLAPDERRLLQQTYVGGVL
ncbi:TauD/TfdA family dioxygenase [Streptomyces sp. IBSNAI002]|uniref:TauD/TfdA family dioxygenase n=1 Tax=Streptomyces sp. IBSNAI002 TaxID=3457500 RepID=UPI003FD190B5